MATTWIRPVHKGKSKSVVQTLIDTIGYADNPAKSNNFEYVKSYGCDYFTAANEFALSKQMYEQRTGRGRDRGDIIAYHLRQSFKPGEIEPQEALEIGYALAEKFTHGRHAFVAAVHTDKKHIHCHIVFSAVNLDCDKKFRNPMRSMKIVRQISDHLCAEHGLSIVENPQPSRGSYADWLDKKEPVSNKEKLRGLIDEALSEGLHWVQFLEMMKAKGCEYKQGKYIAFKIPGAERFIRVKSLGEDYTEQALRERCIGGKNFGKSPADSGAEANRKAAEYVASTQRGSAPNMLIDIQAKLREGKGEGYKQWAQIFNIKAMSKTLIWLRDNNIDSYDDLKRRAAAASGEYNERVKAIKAAEEKLKNIAELQKQIGTYGRTRSVWEAYKRSGWDKAFFEANRADLTLHKAAKKYFDGQGFTGKLPSINSLKQEYAVTLAEKKKLYSDYKALKQRRDDLVVTHGNAERMLFGDATHRKIPQKSRDCGAR